jgi:DNA-directed RNA polymerase beta subunit/intein/homing endonuclease
MSTTLSQHKRKMTESLENEIKYNKYIEEPWTVIESYFKGKHLKQLVRHQIESYNDFVTYQIPKTITMFNPVHIYSEHDYVKSVDKYRLEMFITFENFSIYRPQIHENTGAIKLMFPQEARLRNFTYASNMTVDMNIQIVVRNGDELESEQKLYKTLPNIHIGKLPIMLKSSVCVLEQYGHVSSSITGECSMDPGGYFIINGSEKTCLGQERAAENLVQCFNVEKNNTKWSWLAEIKSVPDFKCISPKQISMLIANKNNGFGNSIYVDIPRIKIPIPLFVVFRALGITTDKAICDKIVLDVSKREKSKYTEHMLYALRASVFDANQFMTQEKSIQYITSHVMYTPLNMDKETGAKKKQEFAIEVLSNDLFPHCKTTTQKIYFLGYMANKLLKCSFGWTKPDDRDSYVNKRIDLTGTLLNNLFRNYFNKLVKDMQKQIVREINTGSWRSTEDYENIINMTNIYKIVKSTTIENGLKRALATGDFGIKQSSSNKVGVAQVLNRLTYVSSLSHLRRINTPIDKSGKLIPPRKLHSTTWGYLCLTGDTDVLLSNRMDSKKIRDMANGDWVNTIHRNTLKDEPSDIYQCFGRMADKLYEITTLSGRTIKATPEHPFLTKCADTGEYKMKKTEHLRVGDKMIIRHMVKPIPDENTTVLFIPDDDTILPHYRMELLEKGLLNKQIPLYKVKIIARLLGALNTDGHIGFYQNKYYRASFYVGEQNDVYQLADDINCIGFGNVSINRKISKFKDNKNGRITTSSTWNVSKDGSFAYIMSLIGGIVGKKTACSRHVPEWLMNSELSVKREYLSAFQGGDGSRLLYQKNGKTYKPSIGYTFQTTSIEYLDETVHYMNQISKLFKQLGIDSFVKVNKVDEDNNKKKVCIVFNKSTENLVNYADVINYTYCEEKRRTSSPIIEHLKIRENNKKQRDELYKFVLEQKNTLSQQEICEKTLLSKRQIQKIIHNDKYEKKSRYTTDLVYDSYIKDNVLENDCVCISIASIKEVEPEMVYDFTTRSDNHSFVASSFVSSNCPAETPEGASIGVVKNLSYMSHVTIPSNSSSLYEYTEPYINRFEEMTNQEIEQGVKVFINGCWLGNAKNPLELYHSLKNKKCKGIINIYTSIIFDVLNKEIRVCNDAGRLTRPLLRIRKNKLLLSNNTVNKIATGELNWEDLLTDIKLSDSVIEYIDPAEQNLSMIAMKPRDLIQDFKTSKYHYTHCEIHPSTIFGILSSCIPFPEHNQSPRNTYQSAMGKQAMGVYVTNYDNRMDKTAYVLTYPMRPLVDTRIMNLIELNKIPSGCQVIIAIMTHSGYNQEDSILFNKSSIDRGLFQATIYHTEKDEDKKIHGDEEIRCRPDPSKTKGMKFANYNKVNAQGVMPENTRIENRDVVIAKVLPIKDARNDHTKTIKYEDQSRVYRTDEECYVDKNVIDRNGDGYKFCKVRIRTVRKPVVGDKFSSRAGQKGTIGNIIPECDMPFTKEGLKPDIIINPHAIPSRMTIAQLKETLLGKVLLQLGLFGDGTSFGEFDIKEICNKLQTLGFESHGNELMYNGLTGEQIETSVFIGPAFYQRLKHMVSDKMHSRSFGPKVNLTRQPAEGRSRAGGLRYGEMERDCMCSHGASRFNKGRLYDASDSYSVHVCKKCGLIAAYNDKKHIHICNTCENRTEFAYVEIPYACKLLFQELITMNIAPRLITN